MTAETNAERVGRIKENSLKYKLQMLDSDVSWIIEQAERAQEFEKQLNRAHEVDFETVTDLQQENNRLKQELHEWQTGQSMTSKHYNQMRSLNIENTNFRKALEELRDRARNVRPEREADGSIIEDTESRFLYEFCEQALVGDSNA